MAPFLDATIPSLPDNSVENNKAVSKTFIFCNIDAEEVYKITLSFESKCTLLIEAPSFFFYKNMLIL